MLSTVLFLTVLLFYCKALSAEESTEYHNTTIEYNDNSTVLKAYSVYQATGLIRPAVLIVHDWNGRDEFENGKAEEIAKLGYVGFSVDLFGTVGKNPNENLNLMKPFQQNKQYLLQRLQLALDEVKKLKVVDKSKVEVFVIRTSYCLQY